MKKKSIVFFNSIFDFFEYCQEIRKESVKYQDEMMKRVILIPRLLVRFLT